MWYFAWLLGLPLAAAFAVLNAMWFELMEDDAIRRDKGGDHEGDQDRASEAVFCPGFHQAISCL